MKHLHRNALNCDALSILLLTVAALLPRIFSLGRAFTTDEAHQWVAHRSASFLAAVAEGRFADTIITGHPGVTTMWLGSLGLLLEDALQAAGLLAAPPSFEVHLTLMRLPLACATALSVPLAYLLLRRIIGSGMALLAALLWATDPFLVAHSRVLHLDALLTMLMLLALLALLSACFDRSGARPQPHLPTIVLAGIASGLALLTKSPAAFVLPMGGLMLLVWFWLLDPCFSASGPRLLFGAGLLWVLTAALTVLVAWPALWAAPWQAINSVISEAMGNSTSPHKGNFLLDQSYLFDAPGPLYYPVTLLSRLTPWVVLGLVAAGFAPSLRREPRRVPLLLLACAAVLFVAILATLPKKLDRYALPAVPLLHILAAAGLYWLFAQLRRLPLSMHHLPFVVQRWGIAALGLLAAATLAWYHPYYLAYYSPLTRLLSPPGSNAPISDVVLIGWGEGLDQVADWLNERPDIGAGEVATWSFPTLQAYMSTPVTWQGAINSRDRINYLVVYINQVQTGREGHFIGSIHGHCPPIHTVRLRGIDYAWVYERPMVHIIEPPGAQFGQTFILDDYVFAAPDACTCTPLTLTLALDPLAQPEQPLFFFVHITDAQGQVITQFDIPLDDLIFPGYWQRSEILFHPLEIPLPATAPPGDYQIILGLYDPATGTRQPIATSPDDPGASRTLDQMHVVTFQLTETFQTICAAP